MREPSYAEEMAQRLRGPLEADYDESLADDVCHAIEAVIRSVIEDCAGDAETSESWNAAGQRIAERIRRRLVGPTTTLREEPTE